MTKLIGAVSFMISYSSSSSVFYSLLSYLCFSALSKPTFSRYLLRLGYTFLRSGEFFQVSIWPHMKPAPSLTAFSASNLPNICMGQVLVSLLKLSRLRPPGRGSEGWMKYLLVILGKA